jgi:hypothetical protein
MKTVIVSYSFIANGNKSAINLFYNRLLINLFNVIIISQFLNIYSYASVPFCLLECLPIQRQLLRPNNIPNQPIQQLMARSTTITATRERHQPAPKPALKLFV